MKQVMKDIILGYLGRKLDKEDVVSSLKKNQISINTYNAILIGILKKIRKKGTKLEYQRKRLSTKKLVDRTTLNEFVKEMDVNNDSFDECREFCRILMKIPSFISEKKRMLKEDEMEDNLRTFTEHFKIKLEKSKKLFWVIKRGCQEFIKRELDKIRDQ